MKTLKYLVGAASVMMAASFAGSPASAQVTGTLHDLTSYTANTGNEQVCVYCHTPHNGAQGGGGLYDGIPLWNRTSDAATIGVGGAGGAFQTYTSPTLDAGGGTAGAPTGVSLGCLSCHDGVTAMNSLIVSGQAAAFTGGTTMPAGANVLGGDLRNDHPVSITYGLGPVADWVAIGTVRTNLALYGAGVDQVECGSCHDPHKTTNGNFLRRDNLSSGLCLECHVK